MITMATDDKACSSDNTSETGKSVSKAKKGVFGHSIWQQLLSVAAVATAHAYAAPWEVVHGDAASAHPNRRG